MNNKTNLLEENVNFVVATTGQNTYFNIFIVLVVNSLCLFLCFVLFEYLNE